MDDDLLAARDQFTEKMGFLGTLFGFSKLVGQIYGVLYLSPNAVTLDELVETLQVSKGSISTNIRELEKWGGCRKVWVKGDRKDYYEAETSLKSIANKRLMDALKRRLQTVSEISNDTANQLKPSHSDDLQSKQLRQFYKDRLNRIDRIRKKLELLVNTAARII